MRKIISTVLLFTILLMISLDAKENEKSIIDIRKLNIEMNKLNYKKNLLQTTIYKYQNKLFKLNDSGNLEKNRDYLNNTLRRDNEHLKETQEKAEALEKELEEIRTDLSSMKDLNDTAKGDFFYKSEIIKSIGYSLRRSKSKVDEKKNDIEETKRDIERNQRNLDEVSRLNLKLITLQSELDENRNQVLTKQNQLATLINEIEQKSDFRQTVSGYFIGLVAIVILGFYTIAFFNNKIAINIFSGEKGIQFITLFLIIIAIILFGIMGTLGSRELSALLGALSGYILGKTSIPTENLSNRIAEYNSILLKKENNLNKGNNDDKT